MRLSITTKLTVAVAGAALAGLAALFVYDRGYDTGYSDSRDGRPKYDSNRIRNGILCDLARCFMPDGVANRSVDVFNKFRDNILEHYDATSSPAASNEARVCAAMDIYDERENIVVPDDADTTCDGVIPLSANNIADEILKKLDVFLDNPTVVIREATATSTEQNKTTEEENKPKEKKTTGKTPSKASSSTSKSTTGKTTTRKTTTRKTTAKKSTDEANIINKNTEQKGK